ncbi:AraC family transcriptional regulator [Cellulomonas sp. NS3]|uniref:AraC family transcriptional regulator n=1 Tax=Cellulomonas sp. NS3 TaxID=2973977 RepID=UPI0021617CF3|nr:AraC family transcriptional regulator [Cellulomonas sp. NS3]
MDPISGLLDSPRALGAFLLRGVMAPPWSIRVQDRAPITVVALLRGSACVLPASGAPEALSPGDVAILRGPDPYTLADQPGTPPGVLVHPDQSCTTLDGRSLVLSMQLGVRTWGNDLDGPDLMLIGTYPEHSVVSERLLRALPPLVVVRHGEGSTAVVDALAQEIARDAPGQAVVLDRLLDLVLVSAVRAWSARPDASTPAWYRAHGDPVVGRALRLVHDRPGEPWTVAGLAAEVGVSRAAFARRFTELVGEPPMTYLAGWRMALAADALRSTDATLGAVARQVGYGGAFALSAAFRRAHGVSPQEYRVRLRQSPISVGGAEA